MVSEPHTEDRRALDEAAAWVVRRLAGPLDAASETQLRDWLEASPQNTRALDAALGAWGGLDHSGGAARRTRRAAAGAIAGRAVIPLSAVACAALVVLVGPRLFSIAEFATGVGEFRDVALPDGSQVRLDADTRLRVQQTPWSRTAQLATGRAVFAVAKDPRRPFRVRTDQLKVAALGTRFAVTDGNDADFVLLLEGQVEASGRSASLRLRPGEAVRVDPTGLRRVPTDPDVDLAWMEGRIVLRDVTLEDAVAQFGRYSPGEVTIPDRRVAALKVSGSFRAGERAAFLQSVADLHGLRLEAEPAGAWRLTR